jgi:hypothetical protein
MKLFYDSHNPKVVSSNLAPATKRKTAELAKTTQFSRFSAFQAKFKTAKMQFKMQEISRKS